MAEFSVGDPDKIAPVLAEGLKETNALVGASRREQFFRAGEIRCPARTEGEAGAVSASDRGWRWELPLEATVAPEARTAAVADSSISGPAETFAYAVPGQEFACEVHVNNPASGASAIEPRMARDARGRRLDRRAGGSGSRQHRSWQAVDQRFTVHMPENAAATRPYFTRPNDEQPYYDISTDAIGICRSTPYPLAAWVEFDYGGVDGAPGRWCRPCGR